MKHNMGTCSVTLDSATESMKCGHQSIAQLTPGPCDRPRRVARPHSNNNSSNNDSPHPRPPMVLGKRSKSDSHSKSHESHTVWTSLSLLKLLPLYSLGDGERVEHGAIGRAQELPLE